MAITVQDNRGHPSSVVAFLLMSTAHGAEERYVAGTSVKKRCRNCWVCGVTMIWKHNSNGIKGQQLVLQHEQLLLNPSWFKIGSGLILSKDDHNPWVGELY